MATVQIPALQTALVSRVNDLLAIPAVKAAMDSLNNEKEAAIELQTNISQVPSPTFEEGQRALFIADIMRQRGLTDVVIDPSGNVVGRRPGIANGPVMVICAHMDTVFSRDQDVTVRKEGNHYHGLGMGDNASGLRSMLEVLRVLEEQKIQTKGDILFVGSVGEEGNGDIRGSKALFDGSRQIDGFIALDMANINSVQYGATGSHRWRLAFDGLGGHSYLDYGHVPSAIHAMCRAGAKIANLKLPLDPKTTYTIGTIKGGTTVNTIAAHCEVDVDMRSVDDKLLLELEKTILTAFEEACVEENANWPESDAEHQLVLNKTQIGNRPAGCRPADCPVISATLAAMNGLGFEVKRYVSSSTDVNMPMSIDVPSTCIGTGGQMINEHSVREYYDAVGVEQGPQLALLIALTLVGTEQFEPTLPKRA